MSNLLVRLHDRSQVVGVQAVKSLGPPTLHPDGTSRIRPTDEVNYIHP